MVLAVLVFLGGMLTILSPCILPVLPFVFARAEQPFLKGGLPLLVGMALTFAAVATLAAVGGSWAVQGSAPQPIRPHDRARIAGGLCADIVVAECCRLAHVNREWHRRQAGVKK
jgi:hypothetical protein